MKVLLAISINYIPKVMATSTFLITTTSEPGWLEWIDDNLYNFLGIGVVATALVGLAIVLLIIVACKIYYANRDINSSEGETSTSTDTLSRPSYQQLPPLMESTPEEIGSQSSRRQQTPYPLSMQQPVVMVLPQDSQQPMFLPQGMKQQMVFPNGSWQTMSMPSGRHSMVVPPDMQYTMLTPREMRASMIMPPGMEECMVPCQSRRQSGFSTKSREQYTKTKEPKKEKLLQRSRWRQPPPSQLTHRYVDEIEDTRSIGQIEDGYIPRTEQDDEMMSISSSESNISLY